MLSTQQNRLDPSVLEHKALDRLVAAFSKSGHVALIDKQGHRTELPEPLYQYLIRMLGLMKEGRAIVMIPEDDAFTTQAAADFLGVSRQYFVNLIERGEIPFYRVGAHRRVYFKDLLEYQRRLDSKREQTLDTLGQDVEKAALYFPEDAS